MANESLGQIECSGCGGTASIKRRTNGKRLLYLHCKNCGLDQRSGAKLQSKWQAVIDGTSVPIAEKQQNNEWQPESENINNDNDNGEQQRNNNEQNESSSSGWLKWGAIGGVLALIAKFARV